MFISLNRTLFHLCWKKNLSKHQKVSKYYESGCSFKCHKQRIEWIDWISKSNTLCWIFWKKNHYNKSNIQEARQTLKIIGVAINSRIIYFLFFSISDHFRITQENQNQLIRSRKTSSNWGNFFRLSQKEIFLEPIAKNSYIVNYWWTGFNNYVYSTILVITKIYIFHLLYLTSVLLLKMRSQPASITWTVKSTASFYHCWSYMEHSVLWIRCVVYILY